MAARRRWRSLRSSGEAGGFWKPEAPTSSTSRRRLSKRTPRRHRRGPSRTEGPYRPPFRPPTFEDTKAGASQEALLWLPGGDGVGEMKDSGRRWLIAAVGLFVFLLVGWVLLALQLNSALAGPLPFGPGLMSRLSADYRADEGERSVALIALSILEPAMQALGF